MQISGHGTIVTAKTGATLQDFTIQANGATGLFQAPIGFGFNMNFDQVPSDGVTVSRVTTIGDSDGFYFDNDDGGTPPTTSWAVSGCSIQSKFDTSAIPPATQTLLHTVAYTDTTFNVVGPTGVSQGSALNRIGRAVTGTAGIQRLYNCTLHAEGQSEKNYGISARGIARIEMYGGSITTSGGSVDTMDVQIQDTGKVFLINAEYNAAKVTGSPFIAVIQGGWNQHHAPSSTYSVTFTAGASFTPTKLLLNGADSGATFGAGTISYSIVQSIGTSLAFSLKDESTGEVLALDTITIAAPDHTQPELTGALYGGMNRGLLYGVLRR
jgi:hypothetical protein